MTTEDIQMMRAFIVLGVMAIVYIGCAIIEKINK